MPTNSVPPEFANAITLGEPTIGAWQFTVVVKCSCGSEFLWTGHPGINGTPGTIQMCTCKRQFTVGRMPTLTKDGLIQVSLLHSQR